MAFVNPFPMSEEPYFLLDMVAVRLALEAEEVAVADWPDYLVKLEAVHQARERWRKR